MTAVVSVKNLHKTYQTGDNTDGLHVLKGLNFDINKGEFVGITGQSGSGKSTLLNLLGCLDYPTEGDYYLNGINVASITDTELSRTRNKYIGFIFQSFNLIAQLNVLENVELPLFYQHVEATQRIQRAKDILKHVGLDHRLTHMPSQLSGGECQRVAIARALITKPAFLLADEPTGNLDSKTGAAIMDLLYSLHDEGTTLLLVTHDPAIAKALPRNIHMKDGIID